MERRIDISDGKSIRAALKADLGYNARQVRIRMERYSMGRTVNVTIADPAVDYSAIREWVSSNVERIHRCRVTGEILNGGNTYTDIGLTEGVAKAWAMPLVNAIREAAARQEGNSAEPVEGLNLLVWPGQWDDQETFHLTRRDAPNNWRCPYLSRNERGFERAALCAFMDLGNEVYAVDEQPDEATPEPEIIRFPPPAEPQVDMIEIETLAWL